MNDCFSSSHTATDDQLLDDLAAASRAAYDALFVAFDADDLIRAVLRGARRRRLADWKAATREQLADVLAMTFSPNA